MMQSKMLTSCDNVGVVKNSQPNPLLVDPSFEMSYTPGVILCSFVSAKPFLDGAIMRAHVNGVSKAFRIGRHIAQRIEALVLKEGDYLRLGVNRASDGVEFIASIDQLSVQGELPERTMLCA